MQVRAGTLGLVAVSRILIYRGMKSAAETHNIGPDKGVYKTAPGE